MKLPCVGGVVTTRRNAAIPSCTNFIGFIGVLPFSLGERCWFQRLLGPSIGPRIPIRGALLNLSYSSSSAFSKLHSNGNDSRRRAPPPWGPPSRTAESGPITVTSGLWRWHPR